MIRSIPSAFNLYNGSNERCDVIGPCACGAWHTIEYIRDAMVRVCIEEDVSTGVLLTDDDPLVREVGEIVYNIRSKT